MLTDLANNDAAVTAKLQELSLQASNIQTMGTFTLSYGSTTNPFLLLDVKKSYIHHIIDVCFPCTPHPDIPPVPGGPPIGTVAPGGTGTGNASNDA